MDSKVILTAAGIGTILLLLSRRRRQQRQDNEQINNVVESTNVNDTLAARLKDLLNANDNFGFWTVDRITKADRKIKLYNIMNRVSDFKKFSSAFLKLCKNQKTLQDALQSACDNEVYSKALDIAKCKKVITTADNKLIIFEPDNVTSFIKDVGKNKIIGSLKNKNSTYLSVIWQYVDVATFGFELKEQITKPYANLCKIVDPTNR